MKTNLFGLFGPISIIFFYLHLNSHATRMISMRVPPCDHYTSSWRSQKLLPWVFAWLYRQNPMEEGGNTDWFFVGSGQLSPGNLFHRRCYRQNGLGWTRTFGVILLTMSVFLTEYSSRESMDRFYTAALHIRAQRKLLRFVTLQVTQRHLQACNMDHVCWTRRTP